MKIFGSGCPASKTTELQHQLCEALGAAARTMRNSRGALESGQIVDKEVIRQLKAGERKANLILANPNLGETERSQTHLRYLVTSATAFLLTASAYMWVLLAYEAMIYLLLLWGPS